MVTLVNRSSASASEIVSGALQDHDRSLVVGETTFGKALVQSVYRVSEGAGLALTTAHYYTPSGRLIQRPWDGTFDEYLTYTLRDQDPNKAHNADGSEATPTPAARSTAAAASSPIARFDGPVEGFNPDAVRPDAVRPPAVRHLSRSGSRARATRASAVRRPPPRSCRPGFDVTDAMVAEFRTRSEAERVKIDEAAWQKDHAFIRAMIRFEIDLDLFGVPRRGRTCPKSTRRLQFALSLFPEAAAAVSRLGDQAADRPSAPAR